MKVALSWLKEFVDIDITPKELEKKLFSCGFEVEEIIDLSKEISRVVVGKVKRMEKQEGTDHLNLCIIDCGEYGSDIEITTGAQNVFEGALVCTALDNSTLPGGITIKARKMKGIMSNGMLCSGAELGINDDWYDGADVNGILLFNEEDAKIGDDVCEIVGLNDYIFDISITANRPDCQCVLGIAREVAALLNKPLKMPDTDYKATADGDSEISVKVEAFDLCPRYIAHYVKNIRPSKSPRWLRRHLALSGLRSINNIVDITNHTLLEIGQPMHAFDLAKVEGKSIVVRRAKDGEKITTLDEKEFELSQNNLVICDASKPVAIAGVMGGLNSGIADDSKELLFECATFARDTVRKTSRALGQSSDSSLRYEKGVDEYSTELGIARALHLIQKLDCGDITPTVFDCSATQDKKRRELTLKPQQIFDVLGIEVPEEVMIDILKRLDFELTINGENWNISIPRYREDVQDYPDIAEEIIREYGYEHIKPTFLKSAAVTSGGLNSEQTKQLKAKRTMCTQGFYEISTLAFYSEADLATLHLDEGDERRNAIRLMNPITENLSIMRTSLVPSVLNIVVENLKRGNAEGRLFEMGNIYLPKEMPVVQQPNEKMMMCMSVFGKGEDFYTLKGALIQFAENFGIKLSFERGKQNYLHPGITADIICNGVKVGVFGKLANELSANLDLPKEQKMNSNIFIAEIDYTKFIEFAQNSIKYTKISEFAPIKRDLALVCDEKVTCGELVDAIFASSNLVKDVVLFDVYRSENMGQDKKSMAFSVVLSDENDIEQKLADRTFNKILSDVKHKTGAYIR